MLILSSAILFAPFTEPGRAQVLYGSIVGNVTDSSNAPVPGAMVQIKQLETNQARQGLSNEVGGFATITSVNATGRDCDER